MNQGRSDVRQRRPVYKGDNSYQDEPKKSRAHSSDKWKSAACIALLLAFILTPVVILLTPSPIDPVYFTLPEPPEFEGVLEPNNLLQKSERIFENEISGPESIVVDGDHIYTGTADGKILHIYKGEISVLAKLGKEPCGGFDNEPTCGRPLGMRLTKEGYLIVIDTYLGLFKVNVATGDHYQLYSAEIPVNGKRPRFLNDLTIAEDGTIYMTDSSTKWDRRHNRHQIMEGEVSGRVLIYDPKSQEVTELINSMSFANGIQLTRSEEALLICETTRARLLKYHLKGPKKGSLEVINNNLPGIPDNIRRSSTGGYWIGMALIRKKNKISFIDYCAEKPWLRALIMKVVSMDLVLQYLPKYGLVVEVNEEGKVIQSLHDPTGQVIPAVSEVEDKDGVLYFGSYNLPYLGRLYLQRYKKTKH